MGVCRSALCVGPGRRLAVQGVNWDRGTPGTSGCALSSGRLGGSPRAAAGVWGLRGDPADRARLVSRGLARMGGARDQPVSVTRPTCTMYRQ